MNLMFFVQSPTINKVADPTFSPLPGEYDAHSNSTYTITLNDSNMSSHIFYTNDGTSPTHSGDSPTETTFRIASYHGNVNVHAAPGGFLTYINMLAYVNGLADSNTITGDFTIDRGGGV